MAADRPQLLRVVDNLVANAVKFTPDGGTVRLAARHEGDSAVLEVSDTGLGIPHAEQSDLFNRFFRGTNAIEKAIPGSGLGLRDLTGHRRSPRRHDPAPQHPRRRIDLPPRAPARLNREARGDSTSGFQRHFKNLC